MKATSNNQGSGWKGKLGLLIRPKNLAKTVLSAVPVAEVLVEMQNQLESYEVEQQLASLSANDSELEAKLRELENSVRRPTPPFNEWPSAVGEYLNRSVDFVVVYDAGFHSPREAGRELFKLLCHGCLINKNEVLTCVEALDFANDLANVHNGSLKIIHGNTWYAFETDPIDKGSGLVLCRLTQRDEAKRLMLKRQYEARKLEVPEETIPPEVRASTPWMGQELGVVHCGEAQNVLRGRSSFTKLQFDTTTVSHFRRPSTDGLKIVVTSVLPGRIVHAGAATFSRDGTLLGIISDTESYSGDAGRRAVVRSLLGHPRFSHLLGIKKSSEAKIRPRG